MSKVVDLEKARFEKYEHLSGDAICLACRHKWVAVAPIGTVWMECPSCSLERGRYLAQIERDENHWVCECGNDIFHITPGGAYCPNCGEWQNGF